MKNHWKNNVFQCDERLRKPLYIKLFWYQNHWKTIRKTMVFNVMKDWENIWKTYSGSKIIENYYNSARPFEGRADVADGLGRPFQQLFNRNAFPTWRTQTFQLCEERKHIVYRFSEVCPSSSKTYKYKGFVVRTHIKTLFL